MKEDASSALPKVEISGPHRGIKHIDLRRFIPSTADIHLLGRITHFDLSHNELRVLKDLYPLRHLRHLDVSYNRIASLNNLPTSLVKINLSHNELPRLDGLSDLSYLTEVQVDFNMLTNLTGLHPRIPLKILSAEHNRIQHTLGIDEITSLEVLSLRFNCIKEIEELHFLPSCPSLRALSLSGNPVTRHQEYHPAISKLHAALEWLDGVVWRAPKGKAQQVAVDEVVSNKREKKNMNESEDMDSIAYDAVRRREQSIAALKELPPTRSGTGSDNLAKTHDNVNSSQANHNQFPAPLAVNFEEENSALQHCPYSLHIHKNAAQKPQSPEKCHYSMKEEREEMEEEKEKDNQEGISHPMDDSTWSLDKEGSSAVDGSYLYKELSVAFTTGGTNDKASIIRGWSSSGGNGYAKTFKKTMKHKSVGLPNSPPPPSSQIMSSPGVTTSGTFHLDSTTPSVFSTSTTTSSCPRLSSGTASPDVSHHSVTAQLHDALVGKEQAEKENAQLRSQVKKLNDTLKANRRLIGDLTRDISQLRVQCNALKEEKEKGNALIHRLRRNMKVREEHHKVEVRSLREQYERLALHSSTSLLEREDGAGGGGIRIPRYQLKRMEEEAEEQEQEQEGGGGEKKKRNGKQEKVRPFLKGRSIPFGSNKEAIENTKEGNNSNDATSICPTTPLGRAYSKIICPISSFSLLENAPGHSSRLTSSTCSISPRGVLEEGETPIIRGGRHDPHEQREEVKRTPKQKQTPSSFIFGEGKGQVKANAAIPFSSTSPSAFSDLPKNETDHHVVVAAKIEEGRRRVGYLSHVAARAAVEEDGRSSSERDLLDSSPSISTVVEVTAIEMESSSSSSSSSFVSSPSTSSILISGGPFRSDSALSFVPPLSASAQTTPSETSLFVATPKINANDGLDFAASSPVERNTQDDSLTPPLASSSFPLPMEHDAPSKCSFSSHASFCPQRSARERPKTVRFCSPPKEIQRYGDRESETLRKGEPHYTSMGKDALTYSSVHQSSTEKFRREVEEEQKEGMTGNTNANALIIEQLRGALKKEKEILGNA